MSIKQVSPDAVARDLILIYASPGWGKTRLATSLPDRFGRIAYIAIDPGSESLASVLPQYRERIDVFRPEWKDPILEGFEVANTDWHGKGYSTLIIDTFSIWTQRVLDHIVHNGLAQSKHNSVGTPGSATYVATADRADYGMTHGVIRNFINAIITKQTNMNILVLCHQMLDRDETDAKATVGGPSTVGRAMLEWLPSRFPTVIRLDRLLKQVARNGKVETDTTLIARMAQHGVWIARRNEAGLEGNPLPQVELAVDPINFWNAYDLNSPNRKETK